MHLTLAYFILNIDPIAAQIGAIAIHWYGLAYVVAICIGLAVVLRWSRREGISDDQIWGLFVWSAIAGLVGGRLYFVVQQPDLVQNYLMTPIHIISVWDGGMAFFGAIFLGGLTLFLLAPRYGMSRWIALDGGAVFGMVGQIFGRFGNIINGDITGYAVTKGPINLPAETCLHAPCLAYVAAPHILPWAIVYTNPHSFAAQLIPYQPAPVYEMMCNIFALVILWPLVHRLPRIRAGYLFTAYAALYGLTQLVVFFFRGSEPTVPFLGIDTLKQAQWTGIFVMIAAIPLALLAARFSRPWPYSEKNPVQWIVGASQSGKSAAGNVASVQASPALATSAPMAAPATPARSDGVASAPAEETSAGDPQHFQHGRLRNLF